MSITEPPFPLCGPGGTLVADGVRTRFCDVRAAQADWGYPMTNPPMTEPPEALRPGRTFPDFELPDHDGKPARLSQLVDGWPTALHFIRGHY